MSRDIKMRKPCECGKRMYWTGGYVRGGKSVIVFECYTCGKIVKIQE